jgi:hypothetical protein
MPGGTPQNYIDAAGMLAFGPQGFTQSARDRDISNNVDEMLRGLARIQHQYRTNVPNNTDLNDKEDYYSPDIDRRIRDYMGKLGQKGEGHYGLGREEAKKILRERLMHQMMNTSNRDYRDLGRYFGLAPNTQARPHGYGTNLA